MLLLVANGFTAAAAARRLAISPRTVEKHIEHIYAKIGVADKVSAARWATKAGVVADLDAGRCADCPSRAL